jgi:excisionase family DNA binding protein
MRCAETITCRESPNSCSTILGEPNEPTPSTGFRALHDLEVLLHRSMFPREVDASRRWAGFPGPDPILQHGAEHAAVERVTTTNSHLIDVPASTHPTPSAWTAAIVLTVQEAASVVKLTQWAIYRAIQRDDLVAYKPAGRLRINEKDLDAWLEATRVTPAASPQQPARMVPPPDLVAP